MHVTCAYDRLLKLHCNATRAGDDSVCCVLYIYPPGNGQPGSQFSSGEVEVSWIERKRVDGLRILLQLHFIASKRVRQTTHIHSSFDYRTYGNGLEKWRIKWGE